MKVAVLIPKMYSGHGITKVIYEQANAFARNDHKVTIFTFDGNVSVPEGVSLEILGMPKGFLVEKLFSWTLPFNVVKSFRCANKLKDFDIIISHLYPMNWVAYLAKILYGMRYIYYHHGFLLPIPELHFNLIERTYISGNFFLQKWTAEKADRTISISQYCQQQMEDLSGIKSEVIYNSVDMTNYHEESGEIEIREKYRLGKGPILVNVGRVDPFKGTHLLIQAFKLVRREIPDAKLLIIGKHTIPHYIARLRKMADESVIFTGEISDKQLSDCYAISSIYVTASLWESFNLPIVEAQATGKPVVAFNLASHPEVVEDGKTGILVPSRNVNALAKAIVALLKDPQLRQKMGQNAQKMAKKKFSLDRFSRESCRLILEYEKTI